MALTRRHDYFPFDLFDIRELPGRIGSEIKDLARYSMFPPFPWGQWLYGRLIDDTVSKIDGDFIDLGVGMGGMSLFLGLRAREHGRRMYCLDSFTGLPALHSELDNPVFQEGDYGPPNGNTTTQWKERLLKRVKDYGLQEVVEIVPGYFNDTLPKFGSSKKFAFVHIDCDLYTSVRPVLDALYDLVSDGGYIVVDDFFHPAQGPLRAVVSFFNERRIAPVYHVSFPYTVVVKKGEMSRADGPRFSFDGNTYSLDYLRADGFFIAALEQSLRRAEAHPSGAKPAENARLLLSLVSQPESSQRADIYGYWYALQDFWDGFQDHRKHRPVFTI